MSDLFHPDVPSDFVSGVFEVMRLANWHVYQVLTKRPERLRDFCDLPGHGFSEYRNIWLGTSVEDRKYGVPRIDLLRQAQAGVRFLSIEPLLEDLGHLDLRGIDWVIVGGESGPGARPMIREWVTKIRDQCRDASVPFFFKQWGGVRKHKLGRVLDGRTYDEMPQVGLEALAKDGVSLEHRKRLRTELRLRTETLLKAAA